MAAQDHDAEGSTQHATAAKEDLDDELSRDEQKKAATMIQRNYRGYRERRQMKGMGLSASARWEEAISDIRYRKRTRLMSRDEALANGDAQERARMNWQRFSAIASRAAADDSSDDDESSAEERVPSDPEERSRRRSEARAERSKNAKQMDLQYWLEVQF